MPAKLKRAERTPKAEPKEKKRKKFIKVRVSEEEFERVHVLAETSGNTLSEFIRWRVLDDNVYWEVGGDEENTTK